MRSFPILETKRLILREIVQADVPEIYDIHSNAEAMKWFGTNPVKSMEQAEKLIEIFADWRTHPNSGTRWGLQEKDGNTLIGTCGLFRWDANWKKCAIGYELSSAVWGNGFMYEALNAVIHWGFDNMNLNRIEAQIHPQNVNSLRLIENLGFIREGYLREAGYWADQHHDLLQYALLKSDWNSREAVNLHECSETFETPNMTLKHK